MAGDLVAGIEAVEGMEGRRRGEGEKVRVVLVAHSAGGALSQWVLGKGLVRVRGFCMFAAVPGFGSYVILFLSFSFSLSMVLDGWGEDANVEIGGRVMRSGPVQHCRTLFTVASILGIYLQLPSKSKIRSLRRRRLGRLYKLWSACSAHTNLCSGPCKRFFQSSQAQMSSSPSLGGSRNNRRNQMRVRKPVLYRDCSFLLLSSTSSVHLSSC